MRRSPEGRAADGTAAGTLPFARFCEEEALVRAWRELEAAAAPPLQSHAFNAALANTLLSHAHIEVLSARRGDEVAARLP